MFLTSPFIDQIATVNLIPVLGVSPVAELRTLNQEFLSFESFSNGVQRDDNVYPSALNGADLDPTTGTAGG